MNSGNQPSERPDGDARGGDFPWENLSPEMQQANEEWVSGEYPWQTMSPEEYMARYGHHILMCSVHRYPYTNPVLARWIQRFGELLRAGEEEMDVYRRQFLTREEYRKVYEEIAARMSALGIEYAPPVWE